MIREKAIFIKLNQLHISDQELFDHAVSDFSPAKCPCPRCGAVGLFREIHPYDRDMVSVSGGRRYSCRLSIRRFLCESCGHSHALLPDSLIPYGSYTLRFILTVLFSYLTRTCSVAEFCDYWEIAVSTLYGWIHLFIDQYNAWCRILDRICWIRHSAISSLMSASAFPSGFFRQFGFSFLQHHRTTLISVPPSGDRRRKDCRT